MSKNKKSGKRLSAKNLGDVTINDFANSVRCKSRPKKSNSNVVKVLKEMKEEKAWDEKEEYEGDFDIVKKEDEEGTVSFITRKVELRQRRKTDENIEDRPGNVYPLDIWFLISDYIKPEDVCRFAGICKLSYAVICSAKFWFRMYRRYSSMYRTQFRLPEQLQPRSMFRLYGLRTSVIRALFYIYPPFILREGRSALRSQCQYILVSCECFKNKTWVYYFKLKEIVDIALPHFTYTQTSNIPDYLDMPEDVCANPDEHYKLLEVTCREFVRFPPIVGLTFSSFALGVSPRPHHMTLRLRFKSDYNSDIDIVLDPVISYRFLDWWHRAYPPNNDISVLNHV